ncbi:MAG: L,D-transpeptidase family protein [Actinobacteria bacterium]|nr:L,D-transpeptidase family protein [Actinomycetota bacterium]
MRKVPALLVAIVAAVLLPIPAAAQSTAILTLDASARTIDFGERVTLSGASSVALAGATVEIVDAAGTVVASDAMNADGAFEVSISPDGTDSYRARLGDATSEAVTVQVRAVLTARMSPVRLFDVVIVRGAVAPTRPGQPVQVALTSGGRTVARRTATVRADGVYRATFPIDRAGTHRAVASFAAADLLRAKARTAADTTPLPTLSAGDRGVFVGLVERRLVELHYRLAGARDRAFDFRTGDAVVAFHKVQGMEREFVVREATWRRLANPRTPRPRRGWNGFHFEVDQTRQVLYTVEDGSITNVLHVSTGAGGATRDGSYRVHRKLAGFSPNRLYYPSYFDGLRALHGWTEVPTYAASHGCVRIPYWNAQWVFALADYGTRVVIYH